MAGIAARELKKAGKLTIPGLCIVKTRVKPATKAGKREISEKTCVIKAKPVKTIVKSMLVKVVWKKNFIEKSTSVLTISGYMGDVITSASQADVTLIMMRDDSEV